MDGMSLPVSLSPSFSIFFSVFFPSSVALDAAVLDHSFPVDILFSSFRGRDLCGCRQRPSTASFKPRLALTNTWPPCRGSIEKPSGKAPVLDHLSNSVQFRLNDERDKVHDPTRLTSEAKAGGRRG